MMLLKFPKEIIDMLFALFSNFNDDNAYVKLPVEHSTLEWRKEYRRNRQ